MTQGALLAFNSINEYVTRKRSIISSVPRYVILFHFQYLIISHLIIQS